MDIAVIVAVTAAITKAIIIRMIKTIKTEDENKSSPREQS